MASRSTTNSPSPSIWARRGVQEPPPLLSTVLYGWQPFLFNGWMSSSVPAPVTCRLICRRPWQPLSSSVKAILSSQSESGRGTKRQTFCRSERGASSKPSAKAPFVALWGAEQRSRVTLRFRVTKTDLFSPSLLFFLSAAFRIIAICTSPRIHYVLWHLFFTSQRCKSFRLQAYGCRRTSR